MPALGSEPRGETARAAAPAFVAEEPAAIVVAEAPVVPARPVVIAAVEPERPRAQSRQWSQTAVELLTRARDWASIEVVPVILQSTWVQPTWGKVGRSGEATVWMTAFIGCVGSLLLYSAWLFGARRTRARGVRVVMPVKNGAAQSAFANEPAPAGVAPVMARRAAVEPPVATASATPAVTEATEPVPARPVGSLIGEGVTVEGRLVSNGHIAVAGSVIGDMTADVIEILSGGRVEGSVRARHMVVGGSFAGSIVTTTLSIGPDAELTGDVVSLGIDAHATARIEADFRRPKA